MTVSLVGSHDHHLTRAENEYRTYHEDWEQEVMLDYADPSVCNTTSWDAFRNSYDPPLMTFEEWCEAQADEADRRNEDAIWRAGCW